MVLRERETGEREGGAGQHAHRLPLPCIAPGKHPVPVTQLVRGSTGTSTTAWKTSNGGSLRVREDDAAVLRWRRHGLRRSRYWRTRGQEEGSKKETVTARVERVLPSRFGRGDRRLLSLFCREVVGQQDLDGRDSRYLYIADLLLLSFFFLAGQRMAEKQDND